MKKKITPLSPHFGASIENIDLSNNLSNEEVLSLEEVFYKYHLLVFKKQNLTDI